MGVKRKRYELLDRERLKRQILRLEERGSYYNNLRNEALDQAEEEEQKRDYYYQALDGAKEELARREALEARQEIQHCEKGMA